MKYRCIPCDHEFEVKEDGKPRCPQCMHINDLEEVTSKEVQVEEKSRFPMIPVAIVLVLLGVGGYFLSSYMSSSSEMLGENGNVDLDDAMQKAGLKSGLEDSPFHVGKRVRSLAAKLAGENDEGLVGLEALWEGIVARKDGGAFSLSPQLFASTQEVIRAEEFATRLEDGGDVFVVTSYELAVLLLSMARSLDMDAHLAEIHSFAGEQKPADSAGKLGRYGVVFGMTSKGGAPPLFDPYGSRSGTSAKGDFRILSDAQAAAPFYAAKALASLAVQDSEKAMEYNDIAIKLDPDSSRMRCVRGWIFLPIGAFDEALSQFEKAVQISPDAPAVRLNLAEILLSLDPTGGRAEGEIQAALSKAPDYARAHAMLALVHMMHHDMELAETELSLAQTLEPDSPFVASSWAKYYASQSMASEAIDYGQKSVRLAGRSMESLVELAGIYKMTARFEEMRTILDEIIGGTDSPTVRESVKRMFGYEPKTESDTLEVDTGSSAPGAGDVDDEENESSGQFQLKLDNGAKRPFSLGGASGRHDGASLGEGMHLKLDLNNEE